MKVIVVGAGASGITAAINYKRHNKNDKVLIIEKLDKPLKKILATGNGRCNLGNTKLDFAKFNDQQFAKKIINDYNYEKFFDSISIRTKIIDDLAYPVSETAISVRDAFLNEAKKLDIKINVSEEIIDYKIDDKITVITNKNSYLVDKLIFAGGMMSSPKLGSDGSVFKLLDKKGYKFANPLPGLTPLYTKETTKSLDGVRCKVLAKLLDDSGVIYEEPGEVLFKSHGLSGIVVFNLASIIARHPEKEYKISLNLLPEYTDEFLKIYGKSRTFSEFLQAFLNPKLADYLKERFTTSAKIFQAIRDLQFTVDRTYGFEFSQVTVGGILTSEVDENLMSKYEKNVYIIGELLNIDGPCGGYNLTWAFASGLKIK